MINREMQTVQLLSYQEGVDKYGQKKRSEPILTDIEMVAKIYSQSNVSDPRYVDIEMIGITKCQSVTDKNKIKIGNEIYSVKYVIPSGKYLQVLMKHE